MPSNRFITSNVTEDPFVLSDAYMNAAFEWIKSGRPTVFTGEDGIKLCGEFEAEFDRRFIPRAHLTAISVDDIREIRYSWIIIRGSDFPSLFAESFYLKDGRILHADCWRDPFSHEKSEIYTVGGDE